MSRREAAADEPAHSLDLKGLGLARHVAEFHAKAEEEARLGVLLQWGTGRTNGLTKINGVELPERFLEAQLKARGISIDTDWDRYFTHNARVPKAVCDKIAAAALAQPKPESKRPALTVQLWEPCERCGTEP